MFTLSGLNDTVRTLDPGTVIPVRTNESIDVDKGTTASVQAVGGPSANANGTVGNYDVNATPGNFDVGHSDMPTFMVNVVGRTQ
jgi:hypothetical protein